MLFRGFRTAKILSQRVEAERSRGAQGPGERPAPSRQVQASQAGMQVCTPARQPGRRVGLDGVPSRYETKQAGLGYTLLAAYTGTHCGRIRGMPLGARGHYIIKSTVSARLEYRSGTTPDLAAVYPGVRRGWRGSRATESGSETCPVLPCPARTARGLAARGLALRVWVLGVCVTGLITRRRALRAWRRREPPGRRSWAGLRRGRSGLGPRRPTPRRALPGRRPGPGGPGPRRPGPHRT